MKVNYMVFTAVVLAAYGLAAQTNLVHTNAPATLPGMSEEGKVDVVNLINLAVLALTPIITQGIKKLLPKLPLFTLNLCAPLVGAILGSVLHALGVSTATGWGAAIWGGLGTWLYELTSNVKDYMRTPSAGTEGYPASTPQRDTNGGDTQSYRH